MKAIIVIDTDKEIIDRLSKINVKEMCVDIGFDYHLDCNGEGGWCFYRPKSLLSIKPMPQKKTTDSRKMATTEEVWYNGGFNTCIDEILEDE